jgi:HPt (histidine-containing phosphotransfer) domain-containing protein
MVPLNESWTIAQTTNASSTDVLEPAVLDAALFRELLGSFAGDLEIVISIYRTFIRTTMQLVESLPTQDCATQARTLHTLKGSAAMVGADRIADLALRLQHVAANSIHPIVKTRIDELIGELAMFRGALRAQAESLQYRLEI